MKFQILSSNYPGKDYPTASSVYRLVGGKVLWNHEHDPTNFGNSCALRLSRAMNYGGYPIPYFEGQTGSGEDKKWYFYKIRDLVQYLRFKLGDPAIVKSAPLPNIEQYFSGKKGIIYFEVSGWGDATGHVTLWDGSGCGDHCYFTHTQSGVKTTKVSLWVLGN